MYSTSVRTGRQNELYVNGLKYRKGTTPQLIAVYRFLQIAVAGCDAPSNSTPTADQTPSLCTIKAVPVYIAAMPDCGATATGLRRYARLWHPYSLQ